MAIDTILSIGLIFFLGAMFSMQMYFYYRIRKNKRQKELGISNTNEVHLSPKATFRFGLFHTIYQIYIVFYAVYNIWTGKFSWFLGLAFVVVSLILIRRPVSLIKSHHPVQVDFSITLPIQPRLVNKVTPELILAFLNEESVIKAIKDDLQKTSLIGEKEQWRLGLLTPDSDKFDLSINQLSRRERLSKTFDPITRLNFDNQIPLKRLAVLHSKGHPNVMPDNLLIVHGAQETMIRSYPGWSYRLRSHPTVDGFTNIRALEIDTDSLSARGRHRSLTKFLQEDGFPLKDFYTDGDPLTTERGGTLILDKGEVKIIYPDYFVQRSLIDHDGNLVYLGLDENFQPSPSIQGVSMIPSVSKKLYKSVQYNEYVPIVRYRSFPYASDFMLPVLDTPMSDSGWADLFIDTRGKGKLFIAKDKTLEQWYEMMGDLRQLFFDELTKKGYHLLGLTKDPAHLHEYFTKKQAILEGFFIILNWSLV